MSLASRLNPAGSHGPDSGQHGGHCYVDGTLVCGWPGEHPLTYTCRVCSHAKADHDSDGYCQHVNSRDNYGIAYYCECQEGMFRS